MQWLSNALAGLLLAVLDATVLPTCPQWVELDKQGPGGLEAVGKFTPPPDYHTT